MTTASTIFYFPQFLFAKKFMKCILCIVHGKIGISMRVIDVSSVISAIQGLYYLFKGLWVRNPTCQPLPHAIAFHIIL